VGHDAAITEKRGTGTTMKNLLSRQ